MWLPNTSTGRSIMITAYRRWRRMRFLYTSPVVVQRFCQSERLMVG